MDELNGRMGMAEAGGSEHEDRSIEIISFEKQKEERLEKN